MSQVSNDDTKSVQRKKRVQRLKRFLLLFIFTAYLLPLIFCIILLNKIDSMETQFANMSVFVEEWKQFQDSHEDIKEEQNTEISTQIEHETDDLSISDETIINSNQKEENRKVYLTFDDGPSSQTHKILDILAKYNVKATFFVNGKTDQTSKEAYRRIVEEGHTLAMHSYSHDYDEIYSSVENFSKDFLKLQEYLYQETGVVSHYARFPGGSSNSVSELDMKEFIGWLNDHGIIYYDWNISSKDATPGKISAEQIVENCTKDLLKHQTSIILMHDSASKSTTVEALPSIIETIQEMENVELLPITDETVPIQHVKIQTN